MDGVRANARITATMGAVLFALFAAEGLTILAHVGGVLSTHVFLGLVLLPPLLVKLVSTGYRLVRYYSGDPAYVAKGPPPWVLRLLGPVVVLTSLAVVVTGVGWLLAGPGTHLWGLVHKVSFVLWFGAMTIHVLGHARETPPLAAADFAGRSEEVAGAAGRRVLLAATLVCGLGLGVWSLSWIPAVWSHAHRG
jgi:hypothetical protein